MVRAYYPQKMSGSLMSNTNYPPQDSGPAAGILKPLMQYEDLETMAYEGGWFNASFLQRIPLTVNSGQVPSTQTNFPIVINDTYPDLIGEVEAEIRITDENNVLLDYEIQEFDSGTGLLIAWVRQPSLSDGDMFFIYFDNAGASDAQNVTGVWDSTHEMVLHMTPALLDSTSNDNDATNIGTTDAAGKIGRARSFDGNNNTLQIADDSSLDITVGTYSAWCEGPVGTGNIVGKDNGNPNRGYSTRMTDTNTRSIVDIGDNIIVDTIGVLPVNTFYNLTVTYDGNEVRVSVDGVFDNSGAGVGSIVTAADDLYVGSFRGVSLFYEGQIDEVRVSNVARSADYITTEFNNQNDQSTFYSTGAAENVSSVNFIEMEYEE